MELRNETDPVSHPPVIGAVLDVAGSASQLLLDLPAVHALAGEDDPVTAAGGQIGAQVKMRVGERWISRFRTRS